DRRPDDVSHPVPRRRARRRRPPPPPTGAVAAVLIGTWTPSLPDVPARAVVVAPHPDDEVLGCGMAMRWLSEQGCAVTIVACTDGEGSHPQSTAVTPDVLRRIRADERARALELLEVAPDVIRLGLPDGGLGGH